MSCAKKKEHMARSIVSITLNCLSHKLGTFLNIISLFLQPKDIPQDYLGSSN